MVQMSQTSISPSLAKKLDVYSAKNNVSISKDSVAEALAFLSDHTDLSPQQKEDLIEKAVTSVFLRRKTHQNYEGDEQVDPKSFGKEVVLICTEKGIKIKRAPKSVRKEVKDKYEGFSDVALDNAYVILDMQPDLDREDKRYVVIESVLDTLNNNDSFTGGEFNYELFGASVRENVATLREAKQSEKAVDHLVDLLTNDDSYEGEFEDAFEYYDDLFEFEDDDFEEYLDDLFFEESEFESDNFEDSDEFESDYLFKKSPAKKAAKAVKKQAKVQKAEAKVAKKKAKVDRKTKKVKAKIARKDAKVDKKIAKKEARAERREKQGSRIGNILTGGVLGVSKKLKAKKEAKKAAKATAAEIAKEKLKSAQASTSQGEQEPSIDTSVTQIGNQMISEIPQGQEWTGDAVAASLPEPVTGMEGGMGGGMPAGGGGGGGGEMPQDWGGMGEEEPYDEEAESEEEYTEEEELDEDGYPIYPNDFQEVSEEDEGWYPEEEDDYEIANFFGFKKKDKKPEAPDTENMYFENFTGQEGGSGTKVIIALVAIGLIWFICKNGK